MSYEALHNGNETKNGPISFFNPATAFLFFFAFQILFFSSNAQVHYGSAAAYGLRTLVPSYTGNAIQVRRGCDNGIKDIGLTSCGDLDTTTLKTFVLAADPLSVITSSAAAAFSLRRLTCTYSGNAVRVRSSAVTSPTADIGFTANGDLDTTALKLFAGTNSAFVTTWYDQSGNARHATQVTTANQPRIVNAGVIDRQNGMPAVRFLGMGYTLATASITAYPTAACFNGVAKVITDVTYNTIVNKSSVNYPAPLDFYNNTPVYGAGSTYQFGSSSTNISSALPLSVWTYQFSSVTQAYGVFYNGTNAGSGTFATYGDLGNPLTLGGRSDGLTGLNGVISEIVTFAVIPSTTDRQYLEWSQGQYYSISGAPAQGALPAGSNSGFISAWYDQSGNFKTAVQTATASQPRIINAGTMDKNNGKPAINFGGNPQNLVAPLPLAVYPISISMAANTAGAASNGAFVKLGNSISALDGGFAIGIGNSGGDFDNVGSSVVGLKELLSWNPSSPNITYPSTPFVSTTIQQNPNSLATYLNGTNVPLSNFSVAVGSTISGSLFIGGYTNGTNRFPIAKQSEVSLFGSALSNTRRTLIESNQAAYDGITVAGSKYTPPTSTSYYRFVNGVGRESSTDSVSGTRSTKGMGFIVGQTANDFLKDNGDYLTIGMNCPITPSTSTANLPPAVVSRWTNDWYLTKSDVSSNNGTVTVFFDFQDYGVLAAPGTPTNYELLGRNSTASNFSIVTVDTKTVAGARILFSMNASNLNNAAYYTIGTRNISSSPLPIELVSFNAVCNDNKVEVDWSTATQVSNDYFTVERTRNGSEFFEAGRIRGAGTSNTFMHYTFTDEQPFAGTSYYRLRQTDFDKESKTFKLTSVSCNGLNADISIYPNPNNGTFIIEGAATGSEINVANSLGETVATVLIVSARQTLDLGHLPNGIYFVRVAGINPLIKKLIIQR